MSLDLTLDDTPIGGSFERSKALTKLLAKNESRLIRYDVAHRLSLHNRHKEAASIYASLCNEAEGYELAYYRAASGLNLLSQGNLKDGLKEYEWRLEAEDYKYFKWPHSRWLGQDLNGRSLIIIQEQGYGDAIQYIRYIPIIKKKYDCKIYFLVKKPLLRLVKTFDGVDKVIEFGDEIIDKIDYAAMDCSLSHLIGVQSIDDIPCQVPYLEGGNWDYPLPGGPKVGLCWSGTTAYEGGIDRRNIDKSYFSKFHDLPINFISLQYDDNKNLNDFYDTASLIKRLDLVISVDTAIVHLAGALNKPVWLLSRFDNCWRWFGTMKSSPWYPTLRQFIQSKHNCWGSVIVEIHKELKHKLVEDWT